jgi:CubicO group peptidase (beta-lactamase class C family)
MMSTPRLFRFLTLVFLIMGTPLAVLGQSATPIADDNLYRDPGGRFTVPIPSNWAVVEHKTFVELIDPDGDLRAFIVVVPAQTTRVGIKHAWEIAQPDYDRPAAMESTTFDDSPGIDEYVVETTDSGEVSGEFVQAIAWKVGDQVYSVLLRGSWDASIRRNSQIHVIAGGFQISSIARTDISGLAPAPFMGALVDQLDAYIADLMGRTGVPGASVAIVVDGEVAFVSGYGVTESGGSQPVDPDTRMMVGSVTKSMTTTMMASEVDDGLFRWDTPVIDLYPSFAVNDPALTATMTMQNLVCACTGIPRMDLELWFNAGALSPEEVIASISDFEFYTDFGEAYQYSNQMVAAAGYIAADADYESNDLEADYRSAMEARVFHPIGMDDTEFALGTTKSRNNSATPHGLSLFDGYVPLSLSDEDVLNAFGPAGAAWSTATDMSQYLITQMQNGVAPNGRRVVSEENLLETRRPQVEVSATIDYGLGWMIGSFNGRQMVFHGGNTMGFTSEIAFLPNANIGIVVLANAQSANSFTEGVRARLFELVFGLDAKRDRTIRADQAHADRQMRDARLVVEERPDAHLVRNIVGDYRNDALGLVSLYFDERDGLMLDIGEFAFEVRFLEYEGSMFLVAIDPPLMGATFFLDGVGQGARLGIRWDSELYIFERVYP